MEYIKQTVIQLMKKYHTRDPFELADALHIKVRMRDFEELKGMYTVIKNNRFIFLNSNLDKETLALVCTHELGHDSLHRILARNLAFQEFSLLDVSSKPEYEANVFAAHFLIRDEEILEYLYDGYDIASIAAILEKKQDLVMIKIKELNKEGFDFRLPYIPHGNFLKY